MLSGKRERGAHTLEKVCALFMAPSFHKENRVRVYRITNLPKVWLICFHHLSTCHTLHNPPLTGRLSSPSPRLWMLLGSTMHMHVS